MKSFPFTAAALIVIASSLTLSACAHRHGDHHHGSKMDRAAMCEQYAKMSPEQRRTHMEAHHGKMSDEMVQQHEKKMRERCASQ